MFFTSNREKRLWAIFSLVLLAILASLFVGIPIQRFILSQDLQAGFFLGGMMLIALSVVGYALLQKPSRIELLIQSGAVLALLLLFFRLGLAERSHLIEYSILTLVIHQILTERTKNGKGVRYPMLGTFALAFLIGLGDEIIQLHLPDRVFDYDDILFNGLCIAGTLGQIGLLKWVRTRNQKGP